MCKMKKYKFTMNMTILKDYELEAESRDDAEALALIDFKNKISNINPDEVDGYARFKSEVEV